MAQNGNRERRSKGNVTTSVREGVGRRHFLKMLGIAGGAAAALTGMRGVIARAEGADRSASFSEHDNAYPRLVSDVPGEPVVLENPSIAEVFIEVCNQNGVDCFFLCPGTDSIPLQEAFASMKQQGRKTPRLIMSIHEIPAMASAHGYFMITGRPQVLFVHADVGTMNVGGNLHNAYRGRAGVVFCAGRTPATDQGEMAGSRDMVVHWWQDDFDQNGIVRNFVKWEYQLTRKQNAPHVFQRAFQVAASEPSGPVYLTFPREVLMEHVEKAALLSPQGYGPAVVSSAPTDAIEQIANALVTAKRPLIATNYSGRHPGAVKALVQLADLLAVPVVEPLFRQYMNFPANHDMHLGTRIDPFLKETDVFLFLDTDTPYVPSRLRPRPDAKLFQIDIDPIKTKFPIWGFPQTLGVTANTAEATRQLTAAVASLLKPVDRERINERRKRIRVTHDVQQANRLKMLSKLRETGRITPQWVYQCLNDVYDNKTIIVDEGLISSVVGMDYLNTTRPMSYFTSGGSNLGWGMGAALGAKLASPGSRVICLSGDGSYIFGVSEATLWAARKYEAPFLTVIFNNGLYNTITFGWEQSYPRGAWRETGFMGTSLEPSIEHASVARSLGCYSEKITQPDQLPQALRKAVEAVDGGQPAVLDVQVSHVVSASLTPDGLETRGLRR